ncbi:hypothetical protein COT72_02790 [archaeon CG10_big_fil_rev_8_21_14_0_10_43_11]|nr:MAG: hypothetical protein COT72_02790 [archaeon CG10_big_fil_rev_8_21_14_0_10_43_11]
MYKRFHINTYDDAEPTYLKKSETHPFNPRVSKIGLAKMLAKEALHLNKELLTKEGRDYMLSRPCIYGVFSRPVGGFWPVKEKCTGCMRCVQEHPDMITVEHNPKFYFLEDSYWMPERDVRETPVSRVHFEARTGKILVRGMGYTGYFAGQGWDSLWTDMSEIVRPTRDGVHGREYISTEVNLGRKPAHVDFKAPVNTLDAPLPILFDSLPKNMTNQDIMNATKRAASEIGTFFIERLENVLLLATPHVLVPLLDKHNMNLIDCLESAPAVEYVGNRDVYESAQTFGTPVFARIPFNKDVVRHGTRLVEDGVDGLHVYANYHGMSFDSNTFFKDGLKDLHYALVKNGLRSQVSIIASGGITLAEHVPKAILSGADAVGLDTTIPIALEYKLKGNCVLPEKSSIQQRSLDVMWGQKRLVNLMASWHSQLIEVMSAMGVRDVRRLSGETGRLIENTYISEDWLGETIV